MIKSPEISPLSNLNKQNGTLLTENHKFNFHHVHRFVIGLATRTFPQIECENPAGKTLDLLSLSCQFLSFLLECTASYLAFHGICVDLTHEAWNQEKTLQLSEEFFISCYLPPRSSSVTLLMWRFHVFTSRCETLTRGLCVMTWSCIA